MRLSRCLPGSKPPRANAFTIVEALVAIVILMIFALTSTVALNSFDERAARNRNAEAARAIVEDYANCSTTPSTPPPPRLPGLTSTATAFLTASFIR